MEEESIPWYTILLDPIRPNKIKRKGHDSTLILKALIMIDPETGWFEIVQYNDKQIATIANLVEKKWLCRCPLPKIIMYDLQN